MSETRYILLQSKDRDDARKELMEIVRLIKSRQKDRQNKAAGKFVLIDNTNCR